MSVLRLKILGIFHVRSNIEDIDEEEVMATGCDGGKRTRTLLDFNFVKKRKFDEEQDEND